MNSILISKTAISRKAILGNAYSAFWEILTQESFFARFEKSLLGIDENIVQNPID
jgi:hypothetical protein